jgi:hypothetical protein
MMPTLAAMVSQRIWDERLVRIKAARDGEPKSP